MCRFTKKAGREKATGLIYCDDERVGDRELEDAVLVFALFRFLQSLDLSPQTFDFLSQSVDF
jgi:hypothetical protein